MSDIYEAIAVGLLEILRYPVGYTAKIKMTDVGWAVFYIDRDCYDIARIFMMPNYILILGGLFTSEKVSYDSPNLIEHIQMLMDGFYG